MPRTAEEEEGEEDHKMPGALMEELSLRICTVKYIRCRPLKTSTSGDVI